MTKRLAEIRQDQFEEAMEANNAYDDSPYREQQDQIDWMERAAFEELPTTEDFEEPYDDEEGWPHEY